jgi:multidrug efflux pump subunit AcrA (membrane-fusion protein)
MKVGNLEALQQRSFPGLARAAQELDLSFRIEGSLIARPVNVGTQVKTSDLIARIDPRDFEVQLRTAEANLQRASASKTQAERDYERSLSIQRQDPGAISQAAIERAKEALDLAKADFAALEGSVDAAKDALSYTYLQAPFDGTVVATYVENFVVNIPETMISTVPYVHDIYVEFDTFPGVKISADVIEIGTEASETTRTFPVTLIMEQPAGVRILPGMAGRAAVKVRQPSDTERPDIVIPVTAAFSPEGDGKSYVWVIDESANTVSQREVEIQAVMSSGMVVKHGIEPGEMIATAGVHFLTDGQQVRPMIP